MLQPKEYHIALKDLQIFHISLYRHCISAKERQTKFTKYLLDQLKIVLVVDYVMVYKIRDIVRISSTKRTNERILNNVDNGFK